MNKIYTIGVYGFTPITFFAALHDAGIQTLVDIRWRRGVRGGEYAFANSEALQHRLAELGIGYIYRRDLAPPPDMRQIQYRVDDAHKVAKRKRAVLDQEFARAYETQILNPVDLEALAGEIGIFDAAVALLCVETAPAACHRSILSACLARQLNLQEEHLLP